jgi:subtilisin family serine protease
MPEESEGQYYYADGERVELRPSGHFVALRTEEGRTAAEAAASVASAATTDVQRPVQVLELEEYDLVVVDLPEEMAEGPAAAGESLATAPGTAGPGPTVYEAGPGEADGFSEGLIDVGQIIVRFESTLSDVQQDKLLKKYHVAVSETDFPEPGTLLVATTRDQDSAIDTANSLHEENGVEYAAPNFARINARLAESDGAGVAQLIADPPDVLDLVEGDAIDDVDEALAAPAVTPNDPALAFQWGLHKIRAPQAWDISMGNPAISVAIIDEGGTSHEDYSLAPGWDALDNDSNPASLPADGHGTACAGIAGATAGNNRGGAGVAPNSRIRHIRIARGVGGGFWYTTDAIVSSGIRRAVDLGADVLSNSYRVGRSTVVSNAFRYARSSGRGGKGAVIAAAAGNSDALGVIYPARLSPSIPGFLAVGASNQWDQRKSKTSLDGENWWGSNFGPEVDVVAPGVKIYTTDIMGSGGYSSANYTSTFNGTSSATPHVAGLAALILSVDPDLRSWEVEDIIKLTARELGPAGRDNEYGFGRIDARKALEAASKIWYRVWVFPVFLGAGKDCYIRVYIRMYNSGINTVRLNNLTFRSHSTSGAMLDHFEYRPNPGVVMGPRSSHQVRFNRLLLPANGNQSRWSYRWTMNWGYTYWRPNRPVFPLSADAMAEGDVQPEAMGTTATSDTVEGQDNNGAPGDERAATNGTTTESDTAAAGDLITVNRETRRITVVVE